MRDKRFDDWWETFAPDGDIFGVVPFDAALTAWNAALASRATAEMPKLVMRKEDAEGGLRLAISTYRDRYHGHVVESLSERACRERQLREVYVQIAELRAQVEQKDRERGLLANAIVDCGIAANITAGSYPLDGPQLLHLAQDVCKALSTAEESGIRKALEAVKACDETGAEGLMWHEDAENAVRALLPSAESASKEPNND